jgi:uncharacterized membrane protein YphA (DoxX/SURF4 family)/thiol-disulfide isomerase/thioredoxin
VSTALILARFALAAVFAVAAIAKLADMPGSRQALEDFGIPARRVRAGAIALPAAELLAAVLLVIAPTAQAGGALAALLLGAFVVGIARALAGGRAPDCHCFGQLHSAPAGRETIVRNAVLGLVALFVVVGGPGPSLPGWVADHDATEVALVATAALAGALALACAALWRENRRLSGRAGVAPAAAPAVQPGEPAPLFSVTALDGAAVSSEALLGGRRAVVVFVSSSCGPCVALLPVLSQWRDLLGGRLDVHIVGAGDGEELRRLAGEHELPMLLDDGGASGAFGQPPTPSAVEIDPSGVVMTGPVAGAPAIEALIRVALKRPERFALDVQPAQPAAAAPPR